MDATTHSEISPIHNAGILPVLLKAPKNNLRKA
jgi:hypothetical protein